MQSSDNTNFYIKESRLSHLSELPKSQPLLSAKDDNGLYSAFKTWVLQMAQLLALVMALGQDQHQNISLFRQCEISAPENSTNSI